MSVKNILLLGNPLLNQECAPISDRELAFAVDTGANLADTIKKFNDERGWGRAISAPQIGISKQIIFVNVDRPWLIINPEMSEMSTETMDIWDDCMSFPDLLVKVRRHVSFTLAYRDEAWKKHKIRIEGLFSELLQHEIDHLYGILAVSRAIDGNSFALQSQRDLVPGAVFANDI